MSVAEAEAAIRAYAPTMPMAHTRSAFRYSDGVERLSTATYVSEIQAESSHPDEGFSVYFTAPPGEPRVKMIKRWQGAEGANLPPMAVYINAMIDKYGEPVLNASVPQGSRPSVILRWHFPADAALCADVGPQGWVVGMHQAATIDYVARLRAAGQEPETCASILQARLTAPSEDVSVTHVQMELSDLALGATSATATLAWLDETEQEARRARLENAEAPRL
ncbi:MAG: hypothetical protein CME59_01060 [Halioglobus sp.]|nr:hypothetical protein [Halioglobus sp.]|tara:strand:+ start:3133 stop:3798 length:666 start_codon:yes stop_codon:yes gene_type:complete